MNYLGIRFSGTWNILCRIISLSSHVSPGLIFIALIDQDLSEKRIEMQPETHARRAFLACLYPNQVTPGFELSWPMC